MLDKMAKDKEKELMKWMIYKWKYHSFLLLLYRLKRINEKSLFLYNKKIFFFLNFRQKLDFDIFEKMRIILIF